MDVNWGGVDYSQAVVDTTGKYQENAVKIWTA
jgi:hypothetical protein